MSHKFLFDANFHFLLRSIDQEFSEETRQKGCPYCGGFLDQAAYPRSPLGMPIEFRELYEQRMSFCCRECRKRTTSASVRFFGRRWFPAPILVLISALMLGINERRQKQIQAYFGILVSTSTWKRWRKWWKESFEETSFWRNFRSFIPPPQREGPFPGVFLEVFQGNLEEKMFRLLKFLSPLTVASLRTI